MTLDFSVDGQAKIRMDAYLGTLLEELPAGMLGKAATPAPAAHLFKVDPDGLTLGVEEAELFHSRTVKFLFLCKRARLDIQTPIAFLCTARVSSPDVDDKKKLRRVLSYLDCTQGACV